MRDCPTIEAPTVPLIVHRIAVDECMSRQSCNYHKCHRCVFRGKAAGWQPEGNDSLPRVASSRTGERAVPSKTVEVPRPEGAPSKAMPKAKPARAKQPAKK